MAIFNSCVGSPEGFRVGPNLDGKLDISEVKVLLKAGKPSMKDREIEAIFKKVDKTLGS